jgi:hypothetical protein
MAVRRLDGEGWAAALRRLAEYQQDAVLGWATVLAPEGWTLFAVTVRAGERLPERSHAYNRLRIKRQMVAPSQVADLLRRGFVTRLHGGREFRELRDEEGTAYWVTSRTDFGMVGSVETPAYYFSADLGASNPTQHALLQDPIFGLGEPYYPTGIDALLEILFRVTQDQGRRDLMSQVVIHLPYRQAFITGLDYVEKHGMVVGVEERLGGGAADHQIQGVWKLHRSDRELAREVKPLSGQGNVTFDTGAEPVYFAVSLQDKSGLLVDAFERERRPDFVAALDPLPASALPEAFDFLASVWRNITGQNLFANQRLSPAAGLAESAANRQEFAARLSDFADVLKALQIPDSALDPKDLPGLDKGSSIGRLRSAMSMLPGVDAGAVEQPLNVLRDINLMRNALQHANARPDLPTIMARLGVQYPPDWADAWEVTRHRAVTAIADVRRTLLAALP